MNLQSLFKSIYPEGSLQGQCFTFLHKLVDFPPVGNLIGAKIKALNSFGIPLSKLDSFKVGDIVLFQYPVFGHGAIINAIIGNNLQLTESNFNLDGRTHHGRLVAIHDLRTLGVFRGAAKYQVPQPLYPIQLTVKLLHNQPLWPSLLQHMANLQNWFWQASSQRIELIIDYKLSTYGDWPIVYTGPVLGGNNVGIIEQAWFEQNVVAQNPGNIVVLNMSRISWQGQVFNDPTKIEQGYAYETGKLPGMIMTVADEHDDYYPYYPALGAYAKTVAHEIIHLLYGLCANSNVVPGGDYTHNHFYGLNGYPMKPEDCFNDFDYLTLSQKINP